MQGCGFILLALVTQFETRQSQRLQMTKTFKINLHRNVPGDRMDCCLRGMNTVTVCWVERRLPLPLLFSNVCVLFPCRYSPAEGSMKLASLLSASAAEPPFHYLSLLTRTDCGCQPTSPSTPPHPIPSLHPHPLPSSQQPAEKRLELCPFPVATSSTIATHAEQSQQPTVAAS